MIPHTQGGRIQIIPYKNNTRRNITHALKQSNHDIIPPQSNATFSNTEIPLRRTRHEHDMLNLSDLIRPENPKQVSKRQTSYQVNKL